MRLETLDDGSKLEAAWHEALSSSLSYFKALLQSSNSSSWKPVQVLPLTSSTTAHDSPRPTPSGSKKRKLGHVSASDVRVHRRSGKHGEVFRAVLDVDCGHDVSIEDFRGCLVTPETRPTWDRMVEEAMTEDLLDAHTRVTRTRFRLGWPSSPRDTVTISKTLVDQHTLLDISTSLPRSRHEPAYLRPAPPYVRAQISLLAWCVQLPDSATEVPKGKCRITCFWSWNPKGAWAVGGGVPQHLPSLMVGLVNQVNEESDRVPILTGYGPEVSIGSVSYDPVRVTLNVGYAIVSEHVGEGSTPSRQVEFGISSAQSWDVQIYVKTQHGEESPSTSWTSFVGQAASSTQGSPKRLVLRFCHAALPPNEELVRVSVSIERTSSSASGVRINGIPVAVEPMAPQIGKRPLLEETASTSGISLRTMSTVEPLSSSRDVSVDRKSMERANATQKGIASLVKRNYIYFTSLLQEPEPKWRPVLDSRGVAIHQLNSIDKTLVVFRAEAVFVGVGIWDLYATIASPGGRMIWDKSHDDANLLEDVNELTDLWHFKTKPAWPVSARDSVILRTTYKSPSSVHMFGFSVDDTELFPHIPPVIDPTVIRTQIDLQGWSIESLSPNTTQVTLVEQSDPRGWSNKSSIPQVMMSTLAGIGDFSIKHGAPPITTRLAGAKAISSRYDVEKETFRYEYESEDTRRSNSSSTATSFPLPVAVRNPDASGSDSTSLKSLDQKRSIIMIECEIRCDAEKWSNNFVLMIDPPHRSISALKRHRLSSAGGGLWLTIEHDPAVLGAEKVVITVKRGSSVPGSKTSITANGHKVKIDLEEMNENDVQLLVRQKRSRPTRLPLDQPPALGTLRRKQSIMEVPNATRPAPPTPPTTYARIAMPLSRWYSVAADSTRAALIPMPAAPNQPASSIPVDAAVQALGQLARMHADRDGESTDPNGWQPVSERDGLKVEKRVVQHVSETFPVYRAGRIIEGFTAEEVSATVSSLRKDERYDRPQRLESYGHGVTTSQVSAFTTFPFRSRNMLVSTIVARQPDGPPPSPSINPSTSLSTIFHASTSLFDTSATGFDPAKYNTTVLPDGQIILEGWILETIDPYSHEQYPIPSTRCMYVVAADYSGNIPLSVNNLLNGSLPRSILSVEAMLKARGPPCRAQIPNMSVMMPDNNAVTGPWSLEGADADKAGVDERIEQDDYALTITVSPSTSSGDKRDGTLSPGLRHNESRVSVASTRSTIIDLGEDIRRGRRDLVVCEVHIGQNMIQSGADISLRGIALPVAQNPPDSTRSDSIMSYNLPQQQIDLPFKVSIIALAPSVLQSASLDPTNPARHLLRVTLPTSEYEAPITDPLTGKSAPAPRPRWFLDLLNDGAVVQLKLKTRVEQPAKYIMDAEEVEVEDERKVRGFQKDSRARLPQLVPRGTPGSKSLEKPLAVARDLMSAPPPKSPEVSEDDHATASTADAEQSLEPDKVEVSEIVPPTPLPAAQSRYSFWKYPYPRLGRFVNSAPGSTLPSPSKQDLTLEPEEDLSLSKTNDRPATATTITSSTTLDRNTPHPLLTPTSLIICCLLSLLLGSLLRSLLSEADFVIHLPAGKEPPVNGAGEGEWRELKRLAEWKLGWGRDLVIAIARR